MNLGVLVEYGMDLKRSECGILKEDTMTQYKEMVERAKKLQEAQEWANGVKSIHAHKLNSMWFDNRPQDTIDAGVTDVEYNDGRIMRTLANGKKVWFNDVALTDEQLLDLYDRA